MFQDNLIFLRKLNKMTQEALADHLGISRQTVSKWETGESAPDIHQCRRLADVFGVSLDDLVRYEPGPGKLPLPPKGKHVFGSVKVGEKGQIVIPAKARKIFNIQPGDAIIVLGDEAQGIALLKEEAFMYMIEAIQRESGQNSP